MKFKIKSIQIEIEWLAITLIFISIFSIKVRNYLMSYFACYLFIVFHELSHIICASMFGFKLRKIKFSTMGVNVNFYENVLTSNVMNIKKFIIFIAGPLSNVILAIIFKDINMIFEINIFLAFINMLPVYPLDGYNITRLMSNKTLYNYIDKFVLVLGIMCLLIGLVQVMLYKSPSIIMFSTYVILINKRTKMYQ